MDKDSLAQKKPSYEIVTSSAEMDIRTTGPSFT